MAGKNQSQNEDPSLISSSTLPEFEDLERAYMADSSALREEEKPVGKPKKSRKPKSAVESSGEFKTGIVPEPDIVQVSADDIEAWASLPIDILLSRMDKKPLGRIEKKAWAQSCAAVINKYAPAMASKYGPEIGLCICLAAIFGTRMTPPDIKKSEFAEGDKDAAALAGKTDVH
jgi:hypothetical protein